MACQTSNSRRHRRLLISPGSFGATPGLWLLTRQRASRLTPACSISVDSSPSRSVASEEDPDGLEQVATKLAEIERGLNELCPSECLHLTRAPAVALRSARGVRRPVGSLKYLFEELVVVARDQICVQLGEISTRVAKMDVQLRVRARRTYILLFAWRPSLPPTERSTWHTKACSLAARSPIGRATARSRRSRLPQDVRLRARRPAARNARALRRRTPRNMN